VPVSVLSLISGVDFCAPALVGLMDSTFIFFACAGLSFLGFRFRTVGLFLFAVESGARKLAKRFAVHFDSGSRKYAECMTCMLIQKVCFHS
jgi:hypothetical protein